MQLPPPARAPEATRSRVSRRSWATDLPTSARAGGTAPCALCQSLGLRAGASEGRLPACHTVQRGAVGPTDAGCLAGCGCCRLMSHDGGGRLPVCHPGPAGRPASERGRPARREGTGGVLARFWAGVLAPLGPREMNLNWRAPGDANCLGCRPRSGTEPAAPSRVPLMACLRHVNQGLARLNH